MLLQCVQITRDAYCFKSTSVNSLYLAQFLPTNLLFYGRVLKSIADVALVRKAADDIIITIRLNPSE
jgi:hypothetical protein